MFGYGLDHYQLYRGTEEKTKIPEVEIAGVYHDVSLAEWGKRIKVPLYVKGQNENMTFLKADWEEATVVRSLDETICAPVKKGDKCVQCHIASVDRSGINMISAQRKVWNGGILQRFYVHYGRRLYDCCNTKKVQFN